MGRVSGVAAGFGLHGRVRRMQQEVRTASEFYAGSAGGAAAEVLGGRLLELWPDLSGLRLLGLGFASPFLPLWRDRVGVSVSARLNTPLTVRAPVKGGDHDCVVDPAQLPFDDLSFDRVLLIHALETTDAASTLLRAVWKLLRDDGKLLLVVPNRRGVWALNDATPFGQGTPFSQRQIARRLSQALFHVERRQTGLYPPPFGRLARGRPGVIVERVGRTLLPTMGGVVIMEAVKDQWSGTPLLASPGRVELRRQVLEPG
ncbi:methyltransferase domain-containing protein [Acetobacter sacchari]|uniref:Methyltransferase domain-containing protein n=1 Tax=Acetobacter sacchari TaxID=2661687 RepID=A0ABS3M056_9PROT|nr:methyltransferase domain-containing protein [Acetobacter sacchari]MBO1361575.1 methyltransferase domain-containing protein [Acetobacter sacchari]